MRALQYFRARELSRVFVTWAEATAHSFVLTKALVSLRYREEQRGYNQWVAWRDQRMQMLRRMSAALASLSPQVRAVRRAYSTLARAGKMCAPMRTALKRLVNRAQASVMHRCWVHLRFVKER